jgi:hypothetical protein
LHDRYAACETSLASSALNGQVKIDEAAEDLEASNGAPERWERSKAGDVELPALGKQGSEH